MILALTGYKVLVAFHVIFVVAMLGVTFTFPVIGPMAKAMPQHAPFALAVVEKVQRTIVFPGIVLVMLTGFWAVSAGNLEFDAGWLITSIILFFLLTATSVFVTYPAVKTAKREAEKLASAGGGPPSQEFLKATKTTRTLGPIMSLTTLVIIFLMVAKPF